MKATGIVRKIDELGRLVLPMEIRKAFKLGEKEKMDIYLDPKNPECVVISKFNQEDSAIGLARNIDELGRIVIPAEIRRNFFIGERDPLEFFTEDNQIYIKKYNPGCIFCGDIKDTVEFEGRKICKSCAEKISKIK